MRLTALWWWIDRWRKSSAYMDMSLAEQGAYRNLLDEAHLRGGPLPLDDRILAKACGDALEWPKVRAAVLARFECRSDGWHNQTLDDVLAQSVRRATNQANYRNRRNTPDNGADNNGNNKPDSPDPSPSPDPDQTPERTKNKELSLERAPRLQKPTNGNGVYDPELGERAGRLVERYAELFLQHRAGARYRQRPNLDWHDALTLVPVWDDARLEKLAVLVLTTDDSWISQTDRGFKIFAMKASWADDRLRAWETEHGVTA